MSLSRKDSFTLQVLQLGDALLVVLSFWIGSILRNPIREMLDRGAMEVNEMTSMYWVLYVVVPFTPLILERFRFYERLGQKTTRSSVWQIVQTLVLIGLIIGMIGIFAKLLVDTRLVLGLGFLFTFCLLLARDRLLHAWEKRKSLNDSDKERVLIAGSVVDMEELLGELDPDIICRWKIVDRFDLSARSVNDLFQLLKDESVERVLFSAKHTEFEKVARAMEACELQGVEAWISASFIRTQIARPVFDAVGNKPMLVLRSTPELSWELLIKSMIDRIGSALLILLSFPFWIFAAIGIRVSSPGAPVLFSQMRAGRYGKPFRMWKFRTMNADAEAQLSTIKEQHGNKMDGPVFKLENDPRIFRFGAFLRKVSIDELPQLLNVVMGDMSLVGPRPLPLYETDAFSDLSHRRRLSVKPGITCEWQAGGRNKITSFDEWVEMDLHYIDNWSLWLDFKILLRTIPAVLFGKGAV
ncbi:MAG: sugar transferase [Verrucomicrobiaceae bacterium]|nr:MAG: sugar transferase [Verrucomicrobiaceae bacterium]